MESDYSKMAKIYEGYQGHMMDIPTKNFRGITPTLDQKNSYMPNGMANAGGADNAYAANQMATMGVENEESPQARIILDNFVDDLRDRGHEGIANELALVIQQAFEQD